MKYILVIIILVILFASNPSLEDHQRAVKDKVSQLLRSEMSSIKETSSGLLGNLGAEMGVMFGTSLVEGMVKEIVRRKDYFFFSLTSVEFDGKNKIIGFGVLGKVIISDEVDKELKNEKDKLKSSWSDSNKPESENTTNESTSTINESKPTYETNSEIFDSAQTAPNSISDYYVNASELNPAYFYDSPNYNTRRNSYFNTREKVTSLRIDNGFAYVEFTNTENQTSMGWISLNDLSIISK